MVPDRIGSDSGTFNLNCTPVCAGRQNSVRKKHLCLSQSDRTILPGLRNDKVTASTVARKGLGKSYTESGRDNCSCIVSFLYGEYHALPLYEETGLSEISGHGGDLRKSDFYGAAMHCSEYHTLYIRKKSQPALFCLQIILFHIGYLIQRPLAPQGRTSPSSLTGSPISELSTLPPKFGTMALSII